MDTERKNFAETLNALNDLGVATANSEGFIGISIYDPMEGHNFITQLQMYRYDATRLFGSYSVYSIDVWEDKLLFTLNAPPEETT